MAINWDKAYESILTEQATGETSFYPSAEAPKSFEYRNETITLTPQEKTLFQQVAGQYVLERYQNFLNSKTINENNAAGIIKALNKIKETGRELAKREIILNRR